MTRALKHIRDRLSQCIVHHLSGKNDTRVISGLVSVVSLRHHIDTALQRNLNREWQCVKIVPVTVYAGTRKL